MSVMVPESWTMQGGRRILAVTVAALSVAACSGGSPRATSSPPTTPAATSTPTSTSVPSATSTTVDSTKAAILAAYRAHWDDVIAVDAVFPVNPLDARLANHASGKQLTFERQILTRLSLMGHYELGAVEFNPVVSSIGRESAIVMDCDFDHAVEVDATTKLPIEQPNVGHSLLRFVMTRVNGAWFASDSTILKSGKGEDACTPA